MSGKPWVYIAGPYSRDPVGGTRAAAEVFHDLLATGVVTPLCPHASLVLDLVRPLSVDAWYAYDLGLLARCDGLIRLPGESAGSDAEVEAAKRLALPVFSTVAGVVEWVNSDWRSAPMAGGGA